MRCDHDSNANRESARSAATLGARLGAKVGSNVGPVTTGLASGVGGAAGFLAGAVVDDVGAAFREQEPVTDGGVHRPGEDGVSIPVSEAPSDDD